MNPLALPINPFLHLIAQETGFLGLDPNNDLLWAGIVILLFVFGLFSFFLEVFVIPGLGAAALVSLAAIFGSVAICFYKFNLFVSIAFLCVSLLIVAGMFYWLFVIFPKSSLSDGIILKANLASSAPEGVKDQSELMNLEGELITDCFPSGRARIQNKLQDVVSTGSPLKKGQKIKVVAIESNQIMVEGVEG